MPAMIDWREHGVVAITFDTDSGEKVIELRRPKLAQFTYFNEAAARFSDEEVELQKQVDEDDALNEQEKRLKRLHRLGQDCIRWWEVVLNGDEDIKGLTRNGVDVPGPDDYPLDLIVPANIRTTTQHWLLPLALGQTQSEMPQSPPVEPAL